MLMGCGNRSKQNSATQKGIYFFQIFLSYFLFSKLKAKISANNKKNLEASNLSNKTTVRIRHGFLLRGHKINDWGTTGPKYHCILKQEDFSISKLWGSIQRIKTIGHTSHHIMYTN